MKRIVVSLCLALVAFFSCTVESVGPIQEAEADNTVILRAVFDADSRTIRQEDGKVFWSAHDEIAIVRASGCERFVSLNASPSASADFQGVMPSGTGSFWAMHPYDPYATLQMNGEYLVTTLPEKQEAVAGTFADDLFISVAFSDSEMLSFRHVVGGLKFSVTEPGIKKVTLFAQAGENLAGLVGIRNSYDRPLIGITGNEEYMSSSIELSPSGGTFEVGEAYHFVTLPGTFSQGFSLLFEKEGGLFASREINQTIEITAARFKTLMEADKNLSWQKPALQISPAKIQLGAEGGSFLLNIRSFGTFHVDCSSCNWISQTAASGNPAAPSGADYGFLATRNTGEAREGFIIVCDDNTGNCYPVTVSQAAGTSLKVLPRHALGMRFTATWCGYCPIMDETFRMAKANLGDGFEYICLYATSGDYGITAASNLNSYYRISGYPTGIIDGRYELQNYNSAYGATLIAGAVEETLQNYPPVTSVALSSSISGRNVTVNAQVFASAADDYKVTAFLLEDDILGYQANYITGSTNTFQHNRVARVQLTASPYGDEFSLEGGSTKSFSWSATLPSQCVADNMVVLVYVQRPFGSRPKLQSDSYGEYYIDNSRSAALGSEARPEWE